MVTSVAGGNDAPATKAPRADTHVAARRPAGLTQRGIAGRKEFLRFACCLLLLMAALGHATVPMPPGKRPAKVTVSFFLVNITGVDEKKETFEADMYFAFEWKDERLKHNGPQPLFYAEEAARDKLEEIWSRQLEFVNTSKPEITNENLKIMPDGSSHDRT